MSSESSQRACPPFSGLSTGCTWRRPIPFEFVCRIPILSCFESASRRWLPFGGTKHGHCCADHLLAKLPIPLVLAVPQRGTKPLPRKRSLGGPHRRRDNHHDDYHPGFSPSVWCLRSDLRHDYFSGKSPSHRERCENYRFCFRLLGRLRHGRSNAFSGGSYNAFGLGHRDLLSDVLCSPRGE